jgi:hypothetical protein
MRLWLVLLVACGRGNETSPPTTTASPECIRWADREATCDNVDHEDMRADAIRDCEAAKRGAPVAEVVLPEVACATRSADCAEYLACIARAHSIAADASDLAQ